MTDYPERDTNDVAYDSARGVAALIAGPFGQIAFEARFASPLSRRRDDFMRRLYAAIAELTERFEQETQRSRFDSEAFTTAALHAYQIFMRSHHVEKLDALINAVQNVVTVDINDELAHVFLEWVDTLTPSHLAAMAVFSRPDFVSSDRNSAIAALDHAVPALTVVGFRDQLLEDLVNRGLVHSGLRAAYGTVWDAPAWPSGSLLTDLGKQFLQFVSAPDWRRDA